MEVFSSVAIVGLMASFFAKVGDGFAAKAGEAVYDKTSSLIQTIRTKLSSSEESKIALTGFDNNPASKSWQAVLAEAVDEAMNNDPEFSARVQSLMADIKTTNPNVVIASGERSVALGGDNSGVIVTGDQGQVTKPV